MGQGKVRYAFMRKFDNQGAIGYTMAICGGAVAQLGERVNRTDEARGSSPLSSTS